MKPLKILFGISVTANILAVGLVVAAATAAPRSASVVFTSPGSGFTTAVLASVPDSARVVIGPVEITLRENETAALQFSVVRPGGQANFLLSPILHDRGTVSVREEGMGIVVTAIREGETVLQTFGDDGISDIAVIRVER